ncbi:LAFA_0G09318g1_1 [Lachancea sp. 'fantastica']|nr:LAFA_0G09318g1_1 [Lachancea sp. 'fantastica']
MHCDRNEHRPRIYDLSAFQNASFHRSNSTLYSSKTCTNQSTGSMYLSNAKPINAYDHQCKKLAEWGIDALNDSSPTIAGTSEFDSSEQDVFAENDLGGELSEHLEDDYSHDHGHGHTGLSRFERIVYEIFAQNPSYGQKFMDEFQYTIIASQLLTDAIRPLWAARPRTRISSKGLNTHRDKVSFNTSQCQSEAPTKFGKLLVKNQQQILRRTMPFFPTLTIVRRCLKALKGCTSVAHSRNRVFGALCIAVYLTLQQEVFHTHYAKFSALIILQNAVEKLQALDKLLHRSHIRYKELTVYKPISLVQAGQPSGSNLSVLEDVLSVSLDLMFYELQSITRETLPLVSNHELFRYCELYDVNLVDLYFAVNGEAMGVSDKASRTHLLKKFLLCGLLSVGQKCRDESREKELEYQVTLEKIFGICPAAGQRSEFKSLSVLLEQLNRLSNVLNTVYAFLVQYKHHLNDSTTLLSNIQNPQDHSQHDYRTATTLNLMQNLQKFLIRNNTKTDEELIDRVNRHLDEISKLWHQNTPAKIRRSHNHTKERHFSGLNLNVIQSPTLGGSENESDQRGHYEEKPVLASAVDFTEVGGSGMDTESEQEGDDTITEQVFANENIEHKDEFRKLTDEELRIKLNERIMSLAIENKQGKQKLRTKKSFGLLDSNRAENIKELTAEGRPSKWNKFTSEESIPVLYELRQMLEKR